MKKQDLINHIEEVKGDKPHYREQYHLGRWQTIESMLELINKLDEPEITDPTISKKETVEIPQFVADFIKSNKRRENGLWSVISRINKISDSPLSSNELEIIEWVYGSNVKADKMYARQEIIALAWLDGYTISPPKTLQVIVKNYDSTVYTTEIPEDEAMKLIEGWKGNE